jgi:hypothetical protein
MRADYKFEDYGDMCNVQYLLSRVIYIFYNGIDRNVEKLVELLYCSIFLNIPLLQEKQGSTCYREEKFLG